MPHLWKVALCVSALWQLNGCRDNGGVVVVSKLAVGDTFPPLRLQRHDDTEVGEKNDLARTDCRVIVYFEPECPHCERVARKDAKAPGNAIPVMWITDRESAALDEFERRVGLGERLMMAPGARRALRIRAVPAAFVVADGRIRLAFPYSDAVTQELLRPYCASD